MYNNKLEMMIKRIKQFHISGVIDGRTFYNGVEYVDLGLPSGTKWATMNVGANSIEDCGLYFQWGDTQGYTREQVEKGEKLFNWDSYKYVNDETTLKYNEEDGKTILDLNDDAAHFHLGGSWIMPTEDDFEELFMYTITKWASINGINGRKFISKKDETKWLFFPSSGYANKNNINRVGDEGFYFSSSLNIYCDGDSALRLYFSNIGGNWEYANYRCNGLGVRGVFK